METKKMIKDINMKRIKSKVGINSIYKNLKVIIEVLISHLEILKIIKFKEVGITNL
jgi:hypothetical protein